MTARTLSEEWALEEAAKVLAEPLPERWQHVQACVGKARAMGSAVPGDEELLVVAVALHDVGFAPEAEDTGFSTLDAARYVRRIGGDARLVDLTAHQFMGPIEAELRGLEDHYAEFGPDERSAVRDAMWTCCLTTGTGGEDVTVRERCEDWRVRYPFDWLQTYLDRCQAELEAAERRTLERLGS